MEREEIYSLIDSERNYQDLKWKNSDVPDSEKPIPEWISYMKFHLSKAKDKTYRLENNEALAEIRKVVALGICALEVHGCPRRTPTYIKNVVTGEISALDYPLSKEIDAEIVKELKEINRNSIGHDGC